MLTMKEAKYSLNKVTPLTWCKYTNQRIQTLHPLIRYNIACAVNECKTKGYKIRVTEALRDFHVQNEYYGYSRTKQQLTKANIDPRYSKPDKAWKTDAKGGESYHNYGLAVDICLINGNNAIFKIPQEVADVFKKYGCDWIYERINKDMPHFQITFGYSWGQLILMKKKDGYLEL